MWWKNKTTGFVLAESMVALLIVVMATIWFLLVESELMIQRAHSVEHLQAARLAKEVGDEMELSGEDTKQSRNGLTAVGHRGQIVVYRGHHRILEVRG